VISLIDVGAFELSMLLPLYLFNHLIRDFLTMLNFFITLLSPCVVQANCHGDGPGQAAFAICNLSLETPILKTRRGRLLISPKKMEGRRRFLQGLRVSL